MTGPSPWGDEILEEHVELPYFLRLELEATYTLTTAPTYDGQWDVTPAAFFYAHHLFGKAFLDDQAIFSLDDRNREGVGKSPGLTYIAAPLPRVCLDHEFRMEFSPALGSDIEYELPAVRFGNYSTIMFSMLHEDILFNLVTLLFAFIGIACILFDSVSLSGSEYQEGLFIVIFGILFAIYNLTESDFNVYVIANPYYTYLLNYASLSTIQIAFLAFIRERFQGKHRTICTGLIALGTVFVLEAIRLADQRMYEDKKQKKAAKHQEVRRQFSAP